MSNRRSETLYSEGLKPTLVQGEGFDFLTTPTTI